MSVSHTVIQNPIQCPQSHTSPCPAGSTLVVSGIHSGIRNPTNPTKSRTVPRAQHFSGGCREDLPVPSLCNINHPVSPQATLGAALYPVNLGGTCLCPESNSPMMSPQATSGVIMLASHDPVVSTPQNIHLKPNIISVSGFSNHNYNISTLKPTSIISSQVIDQSQSTSNTPNTSKSGGNPHQCLRCQ